MSHVVTIKCELRDLTAIEAACKRLGWTFKRGQNTFKWYGTWVGDYSGQDAAYIAADIKPEDYGKCDHAIGVPGASYEIGLIAREGKFLPVFDNWSSGGLKGLTAANGLNGFIQAYSVEKSKNELRRKGYSPVEQTRADGSIVITATAV